jgi:tetratricopeptide (TPR) repeat protein
VSVSKLPPDTGTGTGTVTDSDAADEPVEEVPSEAGSEAATRIVPEGMRPGDERFVAHLVAAGELVAARRYRDAEVEVLRALSGMPSDLRALNLLALVRFKLGRLEEAHATYREIAAAAPQDVTARRNLGLIALKLERIDEAIPDLEMAARLAPGDQRAWSYLGYAYARKGEAGAAAGAFRRAGQEALAVEIESAATLRRPPTAPSLAALQPAGGGPALAAPAPPAVGAAAGAPSLAPLQPGSGPVPKPITGVSRVTSAPASLQPLQPQQPGSGVSKSPSGVSRVKTPTSTPTPVPIMPAPAQRPLEAAPQPLLAFALARLGLADPVVRPEGQALRLDVADDLHVRADAALAGGGALGWEPAFRRIQGRASTEPLVGSAGVPFFRMTGAGEVWVAGNGGRWLPLTLDDDVFYVREDRVLAFGGALSWEAGAIPGDGLRMLQFRGKGQVVVQLDAAPAAVKVTEERPVLVSSSARLYGWVGRLIAHKPRAPGATPFEVSFQGDGVLLLQLPG